MIKTKIFFASVIVTTCVTLVVFYRQRQPPYVYPERLGNSNEVYFSPQIQLRDIARMRRRAIQTIIDMRPDGEAPDEPTHLEVEAAAKASGMDFAYIPIPHESIPPTAVSELRNALASSAKPALLYCRTGRRAVRTFALSEASRAGGPNTDAINAMVTNAGFSADNLQSEIARCIAARTSTPETQP